MGTMTDTLSWQPTAQEFADALERRALEAEADLLMSEELGHELLAELAREASQA